MKLKYYQDRKGGWRWTLYARNGLVVGASTESYATKARAIANFHTVSVKSANAKVEVVEKPKKSVTETVAAAAAADDGF